MGNFGGHALPGSFFIIFSLWWTWQAFRRYHHSKQKNLPFQSSVTFHADCLPRCKSLQWEGILKVFFTSVGLAIEIITAYKDGHFVHIGNGQHATMFFFFGLSGVVDILMHHGAPLPQNTDYAIAMLAFIVEDVLFMFHMHGRGGLDVTIHTLLIYIIHACVVMCALEMRYKNSIIITVARCYLVLLQGTWFWQAGFILYKPLTAWQEGDHKEIMLITMIFTWHMAVNFIVVMCLGLVAKITTPFCCIPKEDHQTEVAYKQVRMSVKSIKNTTSFSDSESEVEFVATRP